MSKNWIAPSILSSDFSDLKSDIEIINNSNADLLHVDVMDGNFVPNISFGQGIVKLDSYEQFRDTAEYHSQKHYYLEKFYPNDLNEWTGITVLNGTVLYGFRKKSSKIAGWKVYDEESLGGETIYVKPDPEIEGISIKIGEILSGNCFGLDFIKTNEGYKVVDVNNSPGIYYDFVEELGIPVAELFFRMVVAVPKSQF